MLWRVAPKYFTLSLKPEEAGVDWPEGLVVSQSRSGTKYLRDRASTPVLQNSITGEENGKRFLHADKDDECRLIATARIVSTGTGQSVRYVPE